MAKASGYNNSISLKDLDEIKKVITFTNDNDGPHFIELDIGVNTASSLSRPDTTPVERKKRFMDS